MPLSAFGLKARILGISLLFFLVAPVAATFFVLQYETRQVRRSVKERMIAGMEREKLVLLKFTASQKETWLHWEHEREFEYRGEMYDVVDTDVKGDTTYYWCWWDSEESHLNRQLGKLVSLAMGDNPQQNDRQSRLESFLESLFFSTPDEKRIFAAELRTALHAHEVRWRQTLLQAPPAPPPELG